jgi:hypothetical protein
MTVLDGPTAMAVPEFHVTVLLQEVPSSLYGLRSLPILQISSLDDPTEISFVSFESVTYSVQLLP